MKLLKFYTIISIGIILSSYCHAQTGEYEKLLSVYGRLYDEDKKDSMLFVARQINTWALANEGDTSLHYAISFRYIGHAVENSDSALFYYKTSLYALEKQNRHDGFDAANCNNRIGRLYSDKGEYSKAEPYFLQSLDITKKTLGEEHPDYAVELNVLGKLYCEKREYAKAEPYFLQCLKITKKIYGRDHAYCAISLNNLGILYSGMGEYAKAEKFYLQSLDIERKTLGENHPDYAKHLNNLGGLYRKIGEYSKAERYYQRSMEILKKTLGDEHPHYAQSLNSLGILYSVMGDYAKAEPFYLESLEIWKKTLGEEHPQYANGLNNLGMLYSDIGEYAKAEKFYLQSLEIRKKTLGWEHPDYADALNNLAVNFSQLGEYAKAEKFYLQCIEIKKKTLGEEHPDYLGNLNNLGVLYSEMGEYAKAETYLLKSLEINKKTLGDNHPDYAKSLNSLGLLYSRMGELAKSYRYRQESIQRLKDALGEENPDYASALNNLGVLFSDLGEYPKAEKFYLQSLEIRKKTLGENHPDYASALNNLGVLYSDIGDYSKAEAFCMQALNIRKKTLGENHPDYASTLNNLGVLYSDMGDYSKAEPFYLESLEIWKITLGEVHPDYAKGLNILGELYTDMGYYNKAEPFYLQSIEIHKKTNGAEHPDYAISLNSLGHFYTVVDNLGSFENTYFSYFPSCQAALRNNASLNSRTRNAYKEIYTNQLYPFLCYLSYREDESSQIQLAGFNHWLFLNGWVGDRDALLSREVIAARDTALAALFEGYQRQRIQLSKYYELSDDELTKRGVIVGKEEETVQLLESELAVRMKSFKRLNAVYDFEYLRQQIKPNEAFVDIIRVPYYDFKNEIWPDSSFYMAYVVTADTREVPLLINLGDGKRMEEEVFPYIMGQITESRSSTMDGAVYNYLWKPLEASLEGKRHIYLSAGGIYHNLNPETIYNAEHGKYLYEEKDIHLVSSGRAFVDQRMYGSRTYTDQTAFLMGSPDFDANGESSDQDVFFSPEMTYAVMRDLSGDGTYKAPSLPSTLREVESIGTSLSAANWHVEMYTGVNASEGQLKKMSSPRILHLATHGFFMEDTEQIEETGGRILGMDNDRVAENPLLRSGLLLSGCNMTFQDSIMTSSGDNGILTAYEAGLLDLSNTELVVLSACETGKGEILNGEGVQGLRKAMTDAGAEHILMSLWKVDDKVTSEYMQIFYGHYAQGKSIRESYNLTRNEIKQKYPQPYYWGAFVLVGD